MVTSPIKRKDKADALYAIGLSNAEGIKTVDAVFPVVVTKTFKVR